MTNTDPEIDAIKASYMILKPLDFRGRERAMRWLEAKFAEDCSRGWDAAGSVAMFARSVKRLTRQRQRAQ